jgi:hypothetical protein
LQEGQKGFWDNFSSWEEAERAWDEGALRCCQALALKPCSLAAKIPYIDPNMSLLSMRLKGLSWVLRKDRGMVLVKSLIKNPLRHSFRYLRSLFGKKSFVQDEDFFFYNAKGFQDFSENLDPENTMLILGFSYCQKPFECPCKRFSDACIADPQSLICRQCLIGKAFNASPKLDHTVPVIIKTVNDIGKVVLDVLEKNKKKRVVFLITCCHMALSMFADLGYMVNISGVGFRLQGRFCNTFRAFQLSEQGIKPGRTELSYEASTKLFDLLKLWRLKSRAS